MAAATGLRASKALILSAALLALVAGATSAESGNRGLDVARLLEEARYRAGLGAWEDAAAILDEAETQAKNNSDLLYLQALCSARILDLGAGDKARILRSTVSPVATALGKVDAALAADRFSYYERADALGLKAELLIREKRWKEALDLLGPRSASDERSKRLARAKAYACLGDAASFIAEEREALARFPEESAFARLLLERSRLALDAKGGRELYELVMGRLARYANSDPELPVLASPLMRNQAARDAVLAFRSAGHSSAAASLRALEYGIIDEKAAAAELLSGAYSPRLADLSELLALAGSPAGRKAVEAALEAWSGAIEVDEDAGGSGDGRPEATMVLKAGEVTSFTLDRDQDGAAELTADFKEGSPLSIELRSGESVISVDYSAYPQVARISFDEAGLKRAYSFGPEALAYAPLAMRLFAGEGQTALFLPHDSDLPPPSELSCASTALEVEESGEGLAGRRRVTSLDKGLPVSSVTYDGERLYSKTSYDKGRPVLERIDVDGDGRFETEKSFRSGPNGASEAAWLRQDEDGDGVFEYREQLGFPFLKQWDYDGNGSVDAQQRNLADGSIERRFSSLLDGHLDETIIVKSGQVVALSRDGAALALLPDSNPKLRWIDVKPYDLGSNLPGAEGLYSYRGRDYRLFIVGSLAFAELLP